MLRVEGQQRCALCWALALSALWLRTTERPRICKQHQHLQEMGQQKSVKV